MFLQFQIVKENQLKISQFLKKDFQDFFTFSFLDTYFLKFKNDNYYILYCIQILSAMCDFYPLHENIFKVFLNR